MVACVCQNNSETIDVQLNDYYLFLSFERKNWKI